MRPRVDFVILSHDRIDTAITAIESALAQDGVDGHVYVIDQNSSAAAFERLRSFCAGQPGVTLHRNARNNGVAKGRNQGIAMGSAPYIIGVDDDASMVGADEAVKALAVMQADDSIGAVGFNMIDSVTREPPPTMVDLKANTAQGRPVTLFLGGGYLLRRSAFDAAGGFDETIFFYHEEGDLCRRIINTGYKIGFAPNAIMLHPFPPDRGPYDSPRRGFHHVRNSIYLAAKYNLSPLAAPLVIAQIVAEGFRHGHYGATVRGILAGLALVPHGLRQRFTDPRVRLSRAAQRTLRADSPTVDMSLAQRLAFRIGIGPQRP